MLQGQSRQWGKIDPLHDNVHSLQASRFLVQGGMAVTDLPGYHAQKQRRYRERIKAREAVTREVAALVRSAIAVSQGALNRTVVPTQYVSRVWPDDPTTDLVLRAATTPATIASTAAIAPPTVAFLETLGATYAGAALLELGVRLTFENYSSIAFPSMAPGEAAWVAEGAPFPHVNFTSAAGVTIQPRKLGSLTSLTGEMLRSSNAEVIIRQALLDSVGPAFDKALFSDAAGDASHPPGLMNGIAPLTATAAGASKQETMQDDLIALAAAVAPVSGDGRIAYVASSTQAAAIALRSVNGFNQQLFASYALPVGTVICVAVDALVSVIGGVPNIDASTEAVVHEENQPLAIVDIGGVVAHPVRSYFQTDSVGLKMRWPVTWSLRDPRGVAWVQAVNW